MRTGRFAHEHRGIILLLPLVFAVCILGFSLSEGATIEEALWWGLVTLSTVGYGDYYPHTTAGKVFGALLIIFSLTFLGFVLGIISDTVIESNRRRFLGLGGTRFRDHVVVCGWTPVSRVAVEELLANNNKVAVITQNEGDLNSIRLLGEPDNLFVTVGTPYEMKVLRLANVQHARAVIVSTGEDTQTLIATLNIKKLNPKARVVVSIDNEELRKTFEAAGVSYITSPNRFSGRLVASASFEPEVTRFVEDVTTRTFGSDLRQYKIEGNSVLCGLSFGEALRRVREDDGSILLSVARDGKTIINPGDDLILGEGDILVALCRANQGEKLLALTTKKREKTT